MEKKTRVLLGGAVLLALTFGSFHSAWAQSLVGGSGGSSAGGNAIVGLITESAIIHWFPPSTTYSPGNCLDCIKIRGNLSVECSKARDEVSAYLAYQRVGYQCHVLELSEPDCHQFYFYLLMENQLPDESFAARYCAL
jgi:hypothetical protein